MQTRSGLRIVIDMEDQRCFFVPDDTNDWLLKKPDQLKKMTKLIEEQKIGFTRIGDLSLTFVDLSEANLSREEAVKKILVK